MKTVKKPYVKIKRLSRRRKIVLLYREIKTYVWQQLKRDKLYTTLNIVNIININALKITADPEIDVDYVKSMSAISIYGHDYRYPIEEKVFESSVYIRPDVMCKLSNLNINDEDEENLNTTSEQVIEHDILQSTSCLRISDKDERNIYERLKSIVVS